MVKVEGQYVIDIFENEWEVISSRKEINCLPVSLFCFAERGIRTWDV